MNQVYVQIIKCIGGFLIGWASGRLVQRLLPGLRFWHYMALALLIAWPAAIAYALIECWLIGGAK